MSPWSLLQCACCAGAHRIAKLLVHAPVSMVPDAVLAAYHNQAQRAQAPQPTLFTPHPIACKPQVGLIPRVSQETRQRQPWRPSSTSASVPQAPSSQAPSRRQSLGMPQSSSAASGCVDAASQHIGRRASLETMPAASSHAAVLNAKLAAREMLQPDESSHGRQLLGQDGLLTAERASDQQSKARVGAGMHKQAPGKHALGGGVVHSQESSSFIPAYRPAMAAREPNVPTRVSRRQRTQLADLLPHHARSVSPHVDKAGHDGGLPIQSEAHNTGSRTSQPAGRKQNLNKGSQRHPQAEMTDVRGHVTAQQLHHGSTWVAARRITKPSRNVSEDPQQLETSMSNPGRNKSRGGVQPGNQYPGETRTASSPLKRHPQSVHHSSTKLASTHDGDRAFVRESTGESRPAPEAANVHGNAHARNAAGRSSYAARWMSSLDAAMRSLDIAADRTSHALQSRLAPIARLPQQAHAGSRAAHSAASAAPSGMAVQKHAGHPQEHGVTRNHASITALHPASSAAWGAAQGNTHRGSSDGAIMETSAAHAAKLHLQEQHQPSAPADALAGEAAAAGASGQQYLNQHPQPSARMPYDESAGSAAASGRASGQAHVQQQQQQHAGSSHWQRGTETRRQGVPLSQAPPQRQQLGVTSWTRPYDHNTQLLGDGQGSDRARVTNTMILHLSESPLLELPQAGHAADSLQHQAGLQTQEAVFSGATPQPHHRPCAGEP